MSFMKTMKTMSSLKDFLTPKNLILLDVVLSGLTDPKQASFNSFWAWFKSKHPNEVGYACSKLEALRKILNDYQG